MSAEKSVPSVVELQIEEDPSAEGDDLGGASASLLELLAEGATAVAAPVIPERIHGVVVGRLRALDGGPLVEWAGAPDGVRARAMAILDGGHVGRDVALVFEAGDPARPVVMGLIETFEPAREAGAEEPDPGRRVVVSADKELVLTCGKASITLTRAGKILIKGAYVSSHSSGTQRIRGATVEIN
jgi:hypothetical protein